MTARALERSTRSAKRWFLSSAEEEFGHNCRGTGVAREQNSGAGGESGRVDSPTWELMSLEEEKNR